MAAAAMAPRRDQGVDRCDVSSGARRSAPAESTVREERTMRADIVPGGTFPDYQLTDHNKKRRRLSDLQGRDPLILVLARGHFCPKDNQQHLKLAALQPEL